MSDTYVHGTSATEQERLAALNRLTNDTFLDFLGVQAGMRVLEVGSGLGILASAVAARGADVVGVERSREQIAAAAPGVTYREGDAHQLDFDDASFDLVYARYLLEHVADPERVVREMRRVAKPGARVIACENDIALMRLDPPCPAFDTAWRAMERYQSTLGGDALIGRRLLRIFRSAGFTNVELSLQPELHWSGSPGFVPWIHNLIGNLESARRGLDSIDAAIAELEAFAQRDDATCVFAWNRCLGVRNAGVLAG
jgi:ubiquinone/menaquinone biosynthesis C-methylase UbiE